jgi:hypothetical protein
MRRSTVRIRSPAPDKAQRGGPSVCYSPATPSFSSPRSLYCARRRFLVRFLVSRRNPQGCVGQQRHLGDNRNRPPARRIQGPMEFLGKINELLSLSAKSVFIVCVVCWALVLLPGSAAPSPIAQLKAWAWLSAEVSTAWLAAILTWNVAEWVITKPQESSDIENAVTRRAGAFGAVPY